MIRHAQAGERVAIEAHLTDTWLATYADLLGREHVEQMLAEMRAAGDLTAFLCSAGADLLVIAAADGRIRGTVAAGMSRHTAFITAMYVRPSEQGRGLGRALIEAALEATPPDRPVALAVLAQRPQIITFYQKFGFEPRGTGTYQVGALVCGTIELVRPAEIVRR
jgi:GNAT superfamily N-acetyltransferase